MKNFLKNMIKLWMETSYEQYELNPAKTSFVKVLTSKDGERIILVYKPNIKPASEYSIIDPGMMYHYGMDEPKEYGLKFVHVSVEGNTLKTECNFKEALSANIFALVSVDSEPRTYEIAGSGLLYSDSKLLFEFAKAVV